MELILTLKAVLMFLGIIILLAMAIIVVEIAVLLGMETWDRHKHKPL